MISGYVLGVYSFLWALVPTPPAFAASASKLQLVSFTGNQGIELDILTLFPPRLPILNCVSDAIDRCCNFI